MRLAGICVWAVAVAAMAGAAMAGGALAAAKLPVVKTRASEHAGGARLIFDDGQVMGFSESRDGAVVSLMLSGGGQVQAPPQLPPLVVGFSGAAGVVKVSVAPGALARVWRLDHRVVLDVRPGVSSPLAFTLVPQYAAAAQLAVIKAALPPVVQIARARAKAEQEQQLQAQAAAAQAKEAQAQALKAQADKEANDAREAAAAAAVPVDMAGAPVPISAAATGGAAGVNGKSLGAVRLSDDTLGGPAFFMPFTKEVGAAAFMRGGRAHLVFDTADPVDLSALKDDRAFGNASVLSMPDATEIDLPVPADRNVVLKRRPDGWVVVLAGQNPGVLPIMQKIENGVLQLQLRQGGDTVVVPDGLTGGRLLVGTELGDSSAVAAPRRMAEFSLLRTALGVVVAPVSDRILLSPSKSGFSVLADRGEKLAMADSDDESSLLPGAAMSRSFDFADMPLVALRKRYAMANLDTATAPQLARAGPRLAMAQALLALGMGNEAAAVLDLALSQEPGLAANPMQIGLHAVAAYLAGRPVNGAAFDQVALGESDEITLWRALTSADPSGRLAMAELAQVWPLALTYPQGLRNRLLPIITERFAQAGDGEHLRAMLAAIDQLARPPGNLIYAHGRAEELAGHLDGAAKLYRAASMASDRRYAAKAGRQLVAMDLARHKIDANEAAQRLDTLLYAWRGDDDELESRLILAKLDSGRHAWRQGLGVLREAETLYPEQVALIHGAEHEVISALANGSNAQDVSPFDLVALLDDNADLLGADPNASQFAPILLDKLMALDLPARAAPILRRMLGSASEPGLRSDLGARLAALTLDQGDGKTALAMLDATESPQASNAVIDKRLRTRANCLVAAGDLEAARKILASAASGESLDLRAQIETSAHDWGAARDSLTALVKQSVPANGEIPRDAEELVLRLAAATAELGDINGLQSLQTEFGSRLGSGARAELFGLLTQKPVTAASDLPRAAAELGAERAASADLATLSHP